ncbi:MAG: TOR complex subunit lst8 [Chrysothrix sp. TS-e1954]|nr:MAG: TOR complex subunit lst8 [Chrysothrix sp. TS-e1954]
MSRESMSVILCTAGYDHTIRFWEALSGICTRQINFSDSQINRLCISPDKRYLAAAGHHTVKLYACDPKHPAGSNPILAFEGHTNNITGVGFHCDAKWMVTSSEDGTVKIWDTKSGSMQRNYSHGSPVNDVVIHPNQGELISCDRSGNVRIWDLGENKCSHQLVPEEDVSVSSVTVASDGSLFCAGNNTGNIYVWRMLQLLETTSLVPVCKFNAHGTYITRVLLSPDVKHLASCSADHSTRIWAVEGAEGSADSSSRATSSTTLASLKEKERATDFASRPATATTGSGSSHDGSSSSSLSESGPDTRDVDGQQTQSQPRASSSGDSSAYQLEAELKGHQRWVWDCAFSADSAYLVTVCSDHYARLWELQTQSIIRQYQGHHRGAVCVALNDYSEAR